MRLPYDIGMINEIDYVLNWDASNFVHRKTSVIYLLDCHEIFDLSWKS